MVSLFTKTDLTNLLLGRYSLKKIEELREFQTGWANYSYYVEADGEKLVVQVIGEKTSSSLLRNLRMQIRVVNYLKKKNFPYKIPLFIKNRQCSYLTQSNNRYFFVYKYIEGDIEEKLDRSMFLELAQAAATFTRTMKHFPRKFKKDPFNTSWLQREYTRIGKIRPKTELDKLILKNIFLIQDSLNKTKGVNLGRVGIIHADFNRTNLLYSKGKLSGIIDFHNIEIAPIIKEIGIAIARNNFIEKGYTREKEKIFLAEFTKIFKLTNNEKSAIPLLLLRDTCAVIWWKYLHMEKNRDQAITQIQSLIEDLKRYRKFIFS